MSEFLAYIQENVTWIAAAAAALVVLVVVIICIAKASKKKKAVDVVVTPKEEIPVEAPVQTEKKAEVKEEPKVEVKEEPKVEVKEEPKAEAKEEPKVEVKEEPKVEVKEEVADADKSAKRTVVGKYEIYYNGEKFYYVLKASNGEKLVVSEYYTSKDGVIKAIEAVKKNAEVGTISVDEDKRGLFQFILTSTNHRKLVVSANYPSKAGATKASESFKRFASVSPIVEEVIEVEDERQLIELSYEDKKGGKIIVEEENGKYSFVLKASNGRILLQSPSYKSEDTVVNTIDTLKESLTEGKFYAVEDKRGFSQFKVYSKSGRLVVASESYPSTANAISAANSTASFLNLATIEKPVEAEKAE